MCVSYSGAPDEHSDFVFEPKPKSTASKKTRMINNISSSESSDDSSSEDGLNYKYKELSEVQKSSISKDILCHLNDIFTDSQDNFQGTVIDVVYESTNQEFCYVFFDHSKYDCAEVALENDAIEYVFVKDAITDFEWVGPKSASAAVIFSNNDDYNATADSRDANLRIGNNKKISSAQNTSSSKSRWEYVPESEFKAPDYFSNQVVLGSRRSSSSSSAVATNKCSGVGSSTKK